MLAVKIELHPYGEEKYAKNIGNVLIWNDGTGTRETGNYGVAVLKEGVSIADGREAVLAEIDNNNTTSVIVEKWGNVKEYPRKLPVQELVTKALINCGYGTETMIAP